MGCAMSCNAPTKSGQPCRRPVPAGQLVCAHHARSTEEHDQRSFYGERLPADELRALAEAAALAGVDAELAVMRVLVRQVASAGDVEAARRAVDTVARLVKIKHDLDATRPSSSPPRSTASSTPWPRSWTLGRDLAPPATAGWVSLVIDVVSLP